MPDATPATSLPKFVTKEILHGNSLTIPVEWIIVPEGSEEAKIIIRSASSVDTLVCGDTVYYADIVYDFPYIDEDAGYSKVPGSASILVTTKTIFSRDAYRLPEYLLREAQRGSGWVNLRNVQLDQRDLRGNEFSSGLAASDAGLQGADLRGMNLPKAEMINTMLQGALLQRTMLYEANLRFSDLRGAALTGADLRFADLSGASLRGADLTGADLRFANLSDADLTDADLTGAKVKGAKLERAILDGVIFSIAVSEPPDADADW